MSNPITFDIALPVPTYKDRTVTVTMKGEGPWSVRSYNQHEAIVIDANGREANPTVKFRFRAAANTVFARINDTQAVVARANELFAAQVAQ